MASTLHGLINFQVEIYVSTEYQSYVALTTQPGEEDEETIRIHVSNVDALIRLLLAAKESLKGSST
jgi:hypothetical protein